jgi:hypothetical protein
MTSAFGVPWRYEWKYPWLVLGRVQVLAACGRDMMPSIYSTDTSLSDVAQGTIVQRRFGASSYLAMSHVRELHRRSISFINVLYRAVGLEGFHSARVVSLVVLALVVSAPAVSSLWYGLRQSHSGGLAPQARLSRTRRPPPQHTPTRKAILFVHVPTPRIICCTTCTLHIMGSGEFKFSFFFSACTAGTLALLGAVKNLRQTRCVHKSCGKASINLTSTSESLQLTTPQHHDHNRWLPKLTNRKSILHPASVTKSKPPDYASGRSGVTNRIPHPQPPKKKKKNAISCRATFRLHMHDAEECARLCD